MTTATQPAHAAASQLQRLCRFCSAEVQHTFVDLGMTPLCENIRRLEHYDEPEPFYPLHAFVCDQCWLVQLREYVRPNAIFEEYAYFSSNSKSWLAHAQRYCETMIKRCQLDANSFVVEIASNDGYLLKNFVERGIPALGVEPAVNVSAVARQQGVSSVNEFFGVATAKQLLEHNQPADLLLGNNVLAHVPDLNDFVGGMPILLKPDGVVTMEFPHLLRLMQGNQFDTVYHEHYSYLSLLTVQQLFAAHGMRIFDVDELPTHGGSLRIYACHKTSSLPTALPDVELVLEQELEYGLNSLDAYALFQDQVAKTKYGLLEFLLQAKRAGKRVAGYGAPGKCVTLLHYCGIDSDLLAYTVDRNVYKQGAYLPGTSIFIDRPQRILNDRPDYVLILPWNLQDEVCQQMSAIKGWGGKFVVPIPHLQILD